VPGPKRCRRDNPLRQHGKSGAVEGEDPCRRAERFPSCMPFGSSMGTNRQLINMAVDDLSIEGSVLSWQF
jgi:hypothetical protein